jgi:hypothetical protein
MYYSVFNLFGAGIWILFVLLYALICAGFSCWLASIKGYGTVAWFGLGFLFGVFALFAIGVAPLRQEERRENDQKNETEPKTIPSKEIKTETLGTGAVLIVSA